MSVWGWNPESFAAVGTAVASLFGIFGFLIAVRHYGLSVESHREIAVSAQRRQAELITVEIMRDSAKIPMYSGIPLDIKSARKFDLLNASSPATIDAARTLVLQLANCSETPVKLVGVVSLHGQFLKDSFGTVYSAREGWFDSSRYCLESFMNGFFPTGSRLLSLPLRENFMLAEINFGVLFRDASGKLWTRRLDGKLLEGTFGRHVRDVANYR